MKNHSPAKVLVSTNNYQKGKESSPYRKKEIQIAKHSEAIDDNQVAFLHMNRDLNPLPSLQFPNNALIAQNNELDFRMQQLVGQTLESKEVMIKTLEEQLTKERHVQKEMSEKFRDQLKELEEEKYALERIKKATMHMEKRQQDKDTLITKQSQQMEDDLDLIPTKDNKSARSNISSKGKKLSSYASKQSFRPDRVKSSIPK